MILLAGFLGGMGLVCIIARKTFLGVLIGTQLLTLGATMIFVLTGLTSGLKIQGMIFGLFIMLGGIANLVVGYALATRLFFLKKQVMMNELRTLKK